MELKKPANPPAVSSARPNVRVLALAAPDDVAASSARRDEALWNSFFARMLLSLLAVAIPFLIMAGAVPAFFPALWAGAPVPSPLPPAAPHAPLGPPGIAPPPRLSRPPALAAPGAPAL